MSKPRAVVVGAGINGLCIAKELLSRGWLVTICDRGQIPCHTSASHGRHRLIHPWIGQEKNETRCAGNALNAWNDLLDEIGFDGFCKTGVIVANITERDSRHSLSKSRNAEQIGYHHAEKIMPQLAGGDFYDLTLYPEFGCLLADQILASLVTFLTRSGVKFSSEFEVSSINPHSGFVTSGTGSQLEGDVVFVAAGTGTKSLLESVGIPLKARTMRCYVLYANGNLGATGKFGGYCWASLGADDDLWGMPPVRGIPLKLGCGDLTTSAYADAAAFDGTQVSQRIMNAYNSRFPEFTSGIQHTELRYNHWTQFLREELISIHEKMILVTSCSGGGFKFAPETAKQACSHLSFTSQADKVT